MKRWSVALTILGSIALLFSPHQTSAHVKWFAEKGVRVEHYELTESAVVIWLSVIAMTLVVAFLIDKRFPGKGRNRKRWSAGLVRFFHAGIGLWLLLGALQNQLFAPVFIADSPLLTGARVALIIVGVLYILGTFTNIASAILIVSYGIAVWTFGPLEMLEHVFVVGIALTSFIITSSPGNFFYRLSPWSVTILRVTLGIALIALAFSEKLFHPELGAEFLQEHNWNFMELLGVNWYTDRLFVLSAGMVELLLGLLIVSGLAARITVVVIIAVFSITATLLGPSEVLGHIPIVIILIVLFRYSGGRLTATQLFKTSSRTSAE